MLPACNPPEPLFPDPLPFPEAGTRAAKKLRVLQVTHCLVQSPQAGTESYVANLGRALADLGLEILFLAPEGPPCQGPQESIPWRETRLLDLPLLQFTSHNQDFQTHVKHAGFEAAFREILQQHPVDLVHFHHTYLSSISLLEVALDQGLPVVLTLHDAWHLCLQLHCVNNQGYCGGPEDLDRCATCLAPWLQERTASQRQRLLHILTARRQYVQTILSRCRLVSPSRFLRNLHYRCGVAPGSIIHLPLGLDDLGPPLDVNPNPDGPPRFVFLGNIIPVKRLDLAIRAFVPLADQALLEIWGGCPQAQRKALRQSLTPHPHINYRGPYQRSDLPRILAGAYALIICSDFENYPLVARESLMLGVPVIASRAGGLPEIVHHGRNGLLFPAGDPEALRDTVLRFIQQPDLRERLRRGIAPVKTIAQDAEELLGLYNAWIALNSSQPDACAAPQPTPQPHTVLGSIIIPTYNNLDLTRDCLEAIERHTAPGTYEIIVVDNCSTDGTPEFLRGLQDRGQIRVILNQNNLGFAPACNQGARAARGDFLVFLNNDTMVTSGWLEELLRSAQEHPRVAAVGAKLLYPDHTVQHAGVTINDQKKFFHIYKYFHKDHPAVNKERTFQILTAACLLVKKEPFVQMGGFDENYHNGCEDVDLCLRFGQQGLQLLYNPRSVVYHLESKTPGRFDREAENSQILYARWHHLLVPDNDQYFHEDGISLEQARVKGRLTVIMYDSNDNPFWEEAKSLKNQGRFREARECYRQAWNFNPYDARRRAIGLEWAEVLEGLGEEQGAAELLRHLGALPDISRQEDPDISCKAAEALS